MFKYEDVEYMEMLNLSFDAGFCETQFSSYEKDYNREMMLARNHYSSDRIRLGKVSLDESMMNYNNIGTTGNFSSRHLLRNNQLRKDFIKKYQKLTGSISLTGYDPELKTSPIINDLLEMANETGKARLKSLLRRGSFKHFENEITRQTFVLSVTKKLFVQVSSHSSINYSSPTGESHTTNIKLVKRELYHAFRTNENGVINHMNGC